ncbi:hypothetical protein D3C75_1386270 [compost metagenome]
MADSRCIPGFLSLLIACQLVVPGVDSINKNGRPGFRLRIRSKVNAVYAATSC